jgi:hypothetical protein
MKRRLAALCVAAAMLAACAKPIPAEHRDMVGTWEAQDRVLQISADGRLAYRRKNAGGDVSIDAPIQQIAPGRFTAGVGPLVSEFKLDQPPRLENGAWTMTVDGVVLHRTDVATPPQVER